MTAPDPECGMIFVRGRFPDNPGAIISRVQREDQTGTKGTFGFQVLSNPDFEVEMVLRRHGLVHSKWPYMHRLITNKQKEQGPDGELSESNYGDYNILSFVRGNTLFQVVRLQPGETYDKEKRRVDEGDPQQENPDTIPGSSAPAPTEVEQGSPPARKLKFQVGGNIQFGCPCNIPSKDSLTIVSSSTDHNITCRSETYGTTLRIQTFMDGKPLYPMATPKRGDTSSKDPKNNSAKFEIPLEAERIVIVAMSLHSTKEGDKSPLPRFPEKWLSSSEIKKFLGVEQESDDITKTIWAHAWQGARAEEQDAVERRAISACLERILGVYSVPTAFPIKSLDEPSQSPKPENAPAKEVVSGSDEILDTADTSNAAGSTSTPKDPGIPHTDTVSNFPARATPATEKSRDEHFQEVIASIPEAKSGDGQENAQPQTSGIIGRDSGAPSSAGHVNSENVFIGNIFWPKADFESML